MISVIIENTQHQCTHLKFPQLVLVFTLQHQVCIHLTEVSEKKTVVAEALAMRVLECQPLLYNLEKRKYIDVDV